MRNLDGRLAALERAALSPTQCVVYGELPDRPGMFRRGDTGRLMTADELAADAGPGATIIMIVYQDEPPTISAPCTVLMLPDNGRGDL